MELFFRSFGEGFPLVILHGLYGASDNWISIAKRIADTYTVYLPDLRNHGQSPHSDIMDFDSMSDDIYELVNKLKLKRFYLVGHSMGGRVAMTFALKWPDLLSGLLIADIPPFTNERKKQAFFSGHSTILNSMLSLDVSSISSREQADRELSEQINSANTRNFILKNLQKDTTGSGFKWKLNVKALSDNFDKIIHGLETVKLRYLKATGFPVVFLKGGLSEYIGIEDFRSIRSLFPDAKIIEVPGASHWLHAEKPEEIAGHIRRLSE